MFLVFKRMPIFFRFMPRASLVDKESTRGRLLRRWDLAAISTGVSEMPFASLDNVFPVQGAMTRISISPLGPMGSAPGMVVIGSLPVMAFARSRKEALVPNLESRWEAFRENTGSRLAPVFFSSSSAVKIFS